MKPKLQSIIYTILVDEMPLAALEATSTEARELLKERWFFMELSELKVAGEPVYKSGARLRVRPATEDEWAANDQACESAEDTDGPVLVYLVDLDCDKRERNY